MTNQSRKGFLTLEVVNSFARNTRIVNQINTHAGKFEMAKKITEMESQIEAAHHLSGKLLEKAEIIEKGQVRFYIYLYFGALITSVCALILHKIF